MAERTVVVESMTDTPAQVEAALSFTPGSKMATTVGEPAATAAVAEPETAAGEETTEVAEPETVEEAPKSAKEMAQRAGKLTREREEAKREADATRKEIAELKAIMQSVVAEPTAEVVEEKKPAVVVAAAFTKPKPTLLEFDGDWEKYTEALTDWKLEAKEASIEAKVEAKFQKDRDEAVQSEAAAAHQAAVTAYSTGIDTLIGTEAKPGVMPDWKEVVSGSDLPWNETLAAATLELSRLNTPDVGPRIVYALAKNPALVEKLAAQTAKGVSRDGFNFLCDRLLSLVEGTAQPATSTARPAKSETTGPAAVAPRQKLAPPPRPVGGSPTAVTTDLSRLAETDPAAFRQLRNEADGRGRRRH